MARVSVIIPIYNVEDYLEQCLNSVVSQTFDDLEIICVLDGPTDRSGIIAKQYAETDKRIVILEQPNSGVSVARNVALSKANGEYISFIDADDWVSPIFIETLYNAALTTGSKMVICNFQNIINDKVIPNWSYSKGIFDSSEICRELIRDEIIYNFPWNKLVRKEIFSEHNVVFPGDLKFDEDYAIVCQLAYYSEKVMIVNEYLYYYRYRETSATQILNLPRITGPFKALQVVKNFLIRENIYESYQVAYEYSCVSKLFSISQMICRNGEKDQVQFFLSEINNLFCTLLDDKKRILPETQKLLSHHKKLSLNFLFFNSKLYEMLVSLKWI